MNETAVRAFIAIEINAEIKAIISRLISTLKKSEADAKWITENQMHLTLKFLGNIEKDKIKGVSDELSNISNCFKPFTINFSKIGAFPNTNHPRVIWLGIDKGAETLKTLNEKIENALAGFNLKKESREFKPHLTLARVKSSKNISKLASLMQETSFNSDADILIDKLTLFKSELNPKGAVYTVIWEGSLQGTTKD